MIKYLPAATKLWPRLCFYSCLWFCPQGGSLAGRTPLAGKTPRQGGPPGRETPWQGGPRQGEPPWQGEPPSRENPPGKETPLARRPPWQGEPPQQREPPQQEEPPGKENPPGRETPPAYGQWAAGTHPTGMHSCCLLLSRWQCNSNINHKILERILTARKKLNFSKYNTSNLVNPFGAK